MHSSPLLLIGSVLCAVLVTVPPLPNFIQQTCSVWAIKLLACPGAFIFPHPLPVAGPTLIARLVTLADRKQMATGAVRPLGVPFGVIFIVANLTIALAELIGLCWQWVPINTMRLPGINGCWRVAANKVRKLRHQEKMRRITARRVVANDMIQLRDVAAVAPLQWTNRPSVHNAVGQLLTSIVVHDPIAARATVARPNPALPNRIDGYLRKDSDDVFQWQVIDCEILELTHAVRSFSANGLDRARSGLAFAPSPFNYTAGAP